jgi:PAS domain S-box-containing protein
LLLSHGCDAILVQNNRDEIVFTSPSTERLIGKKNEEMMGKDVLSFMQMIAKR